MTDIDPSDGITSAPSGDAPDRAEIGKPRLRGRLHQGAFFVSIPAGIALELEAPTTAARLAATVYAVSLAAVFGASAAYHVGVWTEGALRRMRLLDHSMIFVLIAGTYTPFALLVLRGAWTPLILALVWGGAAVGITLKVVARDRLRVVAGALYLGLGWLAAIALPQFVRGLDVAAITLVVVGGVLYTVGAIVLAVRRPDPRPAIFGYHEVWHSFTIGASLCHYTAIMLVLAQLPASQASHLVS